VPGLHEQYADLDRQASTLRFGMWIFLASELLLFSGLFVLYAGYRSMYGDEFVAALHQNTSTHGAINTLVLLTSSLTVALSAREVRCGNQRRAALWVALSAVLGVTFLAIKTAEYLIHIREGALAGPYYRFEGAASLGGNRFFTLYWVTTGAHALHVTAGIAILLFCGVRLLGRAYSADYHPSFEIATLYWHFVDLMWLFIWPIYYLA
jgi:cytochrome c oxidase subunit 3